MENEEASYYACSFLASAIKKEITALGILFEPKPQYVDYGTMYSLLYRVFDLLFQSNIQQKQNGHLLKGDKKFYSLANFRKDIFESNPTRKDRRGPLENLILKCDESLCQSPKCGDCGECLTHNIKYDCSCAEHITAVACPRCLSYEMNISAHCDRCLYEKHDFRYVSQLEYNGIDPHLLYGNFRNIQELSSRKSDNLSMEQYPIDKESNPTVLFERSFLFFLDFLYKMRNYDQHGYSISEENSIVQKGMYRVSLQVGLYQGFYFKNIVEDMLKDYSSSLNSPVCSLHTKNPKHCLMGQFNLEDLASKLNDKMYSLYQKTVNLRAMNNDQQTEIKKSFDLDTFKEYRAFVDKLRAIGWNQDIDTIFLSKAWISQVAAISNFANLITTPEELHKCIDLYLKEHPTLQKDDFIILSPLLGEKVYDKDFIKKVSGVQKRRANELKT